jgi:hypothetical protein
MLHGQLVRIALIVLGLLCSYTGIALADVVGDADSDFAVDADSDFAVAVPEPGTLTLLASGAAALGGISWLHRRKK